MANWLLIIGAAIISSLITLIATGDSFLNLRDRFKNWRLEKKKAKFKETYQENHPDYKFRFGYISNPPNGKCILSIEFKNLSNEIKFIEPISYHYEYKGDKNHFLPSGSIINGEKWPKRLEHGERFSLNVDFTSFLNNQIYEYWKKDVQVFGKIKTSTEELIRSIPIDFDVLVKFLIPLNENYKVLSAKIAQKYNVPIRDIEASLWELQLFNRITSHTAKQLTENKIPILEYLISEHNIVLPEGFIWGQLYRDLEKRQISSNTVESFLKTLV